MLRMPSRVVFPFGYRISIRQLSDTDMDRRDPNAERKHNSRRHAQHNRCSCVSVSVSQSPFPLHGGRVK